MAHQAHPLAPVRPAAGAIATAAGSASPVGPSATDDGDRHFSTAHLLKNLKKHTISSTFITVVAQAVIFALTMGSTMVLARLLTPADFGLIAMVMSITGVLRTFKTAGLSSATIQCATITHAQVSNLFWLNVAMGGAAGLILAVAAPAIAWFYHEPRLVQITLALALTFLLEGAAVQHLALLNRQMRFGVLAGIQVVSTAAGAALGIALAWWQFGYWSLVWLQVATPLVALLLTWSASRWRPQLPARKSGTRPLVTFGASLTASSFLYSVASVADSLLIGRIHGAGPVGLYTRAAALLRRPLDQLLSPLNAVFVPVLARLQSQAARYRRTFLQVHENVTLASLFVGALGFALARPLTLVVLGPQWGGAAVMVAAFSVATVITPLATTCSWLFESQGRGRDALVTSSASSLLAVGSFLVGLPFGPAGVAIAYAISSVLLQLPLFYYLAGRSGPVATPALWHGFLRHAPIWPVVAGASFLIRTWLSDLTPLTQLLAGGSAGVLAGAAFIVAYAPSRAQARALRSVLTEWIRGASSPDASGNRPIVSPATTTASP